MLARLLAGFLGAKGRMEYTVIGDTADLASIDLGAVAVKGRGEAVPSSEVALTKAAVSGCR